MSSGSEISTERTLQISKWIYIQIFQTKLTMIYYDPEAKSGSSNSDPPSIETKVASDFIPVNENKHHRPLPTNYLKK